MPVKVVGKIDCKKIAKQHLFEGKKGTYLDVALHENREGTDQYGNDGFITQNVSREARERGEKGPILGNWKWLRRREVAQGSGSGGSEGSFPPPAEASPAPSPASHTSAGESDNLPF